MNCMPVSRAGRGAGMQQGAELYLQGQVIGFQQRKLVSHLHGCVSADVFFEDVRIAGFETLLLPVV